MTKKVSPIAFVLFILALVTLACGGSQVASQAVDLPTSSQVAKAVDLPVVEAESSLDWQEFTSVEGNFSVLFPVEPAEQVQSAPNAVVETEVHLFMADMGASAYLIAYNDLPAAVSPDLAGSDMIESSFNNLRETFLAGFDGTAISEETITLVGYPGRQIDFTVSDQVLSGGGYGTVRVYAVDTRLYQVAALGTPDALSEEDLKTFLSSFALLEIPAHEPEAALNTTAAIAPVSDLIDPVEPVEAVAEVEPAPAEPSTPEVEAEIAVNEALPPTDTTISTTEQPVEAAPAQTYDSVFPLPEVVKNFYGESEPYYQTNFQTDLTLDEALAFYREAFAAQGLTERTILTNIVEGTVFSLVFDGSPNGLPLVIQAIPLGDDTNINIRYESF
ncbi:MAG: hypothetical protein H6631_02300 [Anaerolineaceae bacterium]|nr:hypothetical protein [Anaerolineaceae bacterium]MCB9099938.1 hypothetical protein [Anaerolineales bacterium]